MDNTKYITDDHRCAQCATPVEEVIGEPYREIPDYGFMKTVSVSYTIKPCGHVFIKAVD